jgi:hypothetical protein
VLGQRDEKMVFLYFTYRLSFSDSNYLKYMWLSRRTSDIRQRISPIDSSTEIAEARGIMQALKVSIATAELFGDLAAGEKLAEERD